MFVCGLVRFPKKVEFKITKLNFDFCGFFFYHYHYDYPYWLCLGNIANKEQIFFILVNFHSIDWLVSNLNLPKLLRNCQRTALIVDALHDAWLQAQTKSILKTASYPNDKSSYGLHAKSTCQT